MRDKLTSFPPHEREKITLRLAGLLYEGRDGLGVFSPWGTPVSPSCGVALNTQGFLFSKGLHAGQFPPPHVIWPEARLQERFRLVCVCGSSGLEVCAVTGERLFLPSLPVLVASCPLFPDA